MGYNYVDDTMGLNERLKQNSSSRCCSPKSPNHAKFRQNV